MRTLSAFGILLCLLLTSAVNGQEKLPSFGKVTKEELQKNTCDYDPDAEAEWLFDVGEVQYNLTPGAIYIQTNRRSRIKVLNEKGIDLANVKITYYSKDRYEEISNIDGYVYNLDDAGNIVTSKLEGRQVFDKKISDRFSQISFALPGVKAGSIIEYRYRSYKKSFGDIDDWYFQKEEPVRYSAYNLVIPEYFDFTYNAVRRQDMEVNKGNKNDDGSWFIMRKIPGLKEEPYSAGYRDYMQRLDLQLSAVHPPGGETINFRTTWVKLNEELMEDESFGKQLNRNVSGTEALKAQLASATTEKDKIRTIYKFVQKNMEWNGQYRLYSTDGIKQAWDKKSGSTADINLLLVNLLRDAGLKANATLACTKDHGHVNILYPFLAQFDEVVACVQTADEKVFVLNAADKYNPYELIPYDLQETHAVIIDRKAPGFLKLGDNHQFRHQISVQMSVDESGKLNGEALVNSYDYGKNVRLRTYKNGKLKDIFNISDGITLTADSMEVKNADNDAMPLEQHLWLKGVLQPSGEYSFMPYNLFTGLGKNPFTAEKRQTDIDFYYPQQYVISGSIILPGNYTIDDLPRNMKMIMPDTSIMLTRILQKDDNILSFRISIDFKRPGYVVEEYPDVKEFFKKLYAVLDEKIVLKKKV